MHQRHTWWHPNFHQEKGRRSAADYREFVETQLTRSRQLIAAHVGEPVDMLAWPFAIHDGELEAAASQAGYVAGFILGNQSAQYGGDMLALPRHWISDSDRSGRLAAILATSCPPDTRHP